MGQATLAFRNLIIRAAIFVALAAMLAWFFGGTIFGKHHVFFPSVTWDGREWSAYVIGNGQRPDDVRWQLWSSKLGEDNWTMNRISEDAKWSDVVGPTVDAKGLSIAVCEESSVAGQGKTWSLIRFANAKDPPTKTPLPAGSPLRSVP